MAPTFGKSSQLTINTKDISQYVTSVTFERGNDVLDTTTYGATAHTYAASLADGKMTVQGLWDATALTGSQTVINAMVGNSAGQAFVWGPAGSTTGNVKYTGTVVLDNYAESAPVADLVSFNATFKITGAVTTGVY